MGKAQNICRAAHILFHQRHAASGFEIQPASVKTDALADQCQRRAAVAPFDIDQTGPPVRGAANRMYHRQVLLQEILILDDGATGLVLVSQIACGGLQFIRSHVTCRCVDQVAGQELSRCECFDTRGVYAFGGDQMRVGITAGFVTVIAILRQ